MSSDLQFTLWVLQLNVYISAAILAAVIYDYVLTFPREVTYVWQRPWTKVSTIFVLVRYIGLSWIVVGSLSDIILVPGIAKLYTFYILSVYSIDNSFLGTAIFLILDWEFPIFLAATDLVMILRVYAMWNRSKWILYLFLFIYVPQVIVSFVFTGIFDNPNTSMIVTADQALNFTFCDLSFKNPALILAVHLSDGILRFVLSVALLLFAVVQTLKQSVDMYRATKRWQPNKYIQRLTSDGILYFLVYVSYNIYVILQNLPQPNPYVPTILYTISSILIFPMMPRFIISVREMYDHDLRVRWEGIDSGFGILSQLDPGTDAAVSAISFADVSPERDDGQTVGRSASDLEGCPLEVSGESKAGKVVEGDLGVSRAIRLEVLEDGVCEV